MSASDSTTKYCYKCDQEFPLTTEFWYKYKGKFRKQCKTCINKSNYNRYKDNPEKRHEIERRSREKMKALRPPTETRPKRSASFTDEFVIIYLSKKQETIIDLCDSDLAELNWTAAKSKSGYYAYRKIPGDNRQTEYLHRTILARKLGRQLLPPSIEQVDHIDLNPLNNRRENLRLANNQQNNMNKLEYRHNTSGFRGVSWDKHRQKWTAHIMISRKHKFLGRFDNFDDAVKARRDAEKQYFGDFAPKD